MFFVYLIEGVSVKVIVVVVRDDLHVLARSPNKRLRLRQCLGVPIPNMGVLFRSVKLELQ